jgi:hypothetical protein
MSDLKISSSELEKRNQKFASGTSVYQKPPIEDEVWGGAAATTGKKGKRIRVRKEGPVNVTKDVLPKRTVDLRALRKHNNAVFAKEKAERDARKRDWEERKSKAKAPVVVETTVEASPEPSEEYRCSNRKRRLSEEEMECERPSSRARTETPEDPVNEFADVALTNMSRFASNRIDWERVFGIKITFQPQSELAVGATTAKVMLSGNSKKVWRFMAHLEYTFPNTFPKKETIEESRSPSPTLESRVRNGEMGSEILDLVCGDRMYDIPYHREEWEMRFGVSLTIRTLYSKDAISKLLKAQLEIAGTPEQIDSFKMYLETNGWLDDVRCLTPEDQDHIDEYFAEVDKWGGNAACA